MKVNMDTIKFESRTEIQEVMKMISKYVEQNQKEKNNKILQEFYDELDAMYMMW